MKKFIASFVAAILVLTAPGLASYAAAGQVFSQSSVVAGPNGMQTPAGGLTTTQPFSRVSAELSAAGLKSALTPTMGIPAVRNFSIPLTAQGLAVGEAKSLPDSAMSRISVELAGKTAVTPVAQGQTQAPKLGDFLNEKPNFTLSAEQLGAMSEGKAKSWASSSIDRILGIRSAREATDDAISGSLSDQKTVLAVNRRVESGRGLTVPPAATPAASSQQTRSRALGALASVGRMVLAGGAVIGLQSLAAVLLPSIFGLVPIAAMWAVSSGVLLLPLALYDRYRLALRDSARLSKVKWTMDAAIGAFLGAVTIAASGALAGLPAVLGAAAIGTIGAGSLIGMMMLPVMTTVAFFLGQIIYSAESGRPFAVPGSMQKMRFPVFQWVMTGVVFALFSGLSAVYTTPAFLAWQFLGNKTYSWDKSQGAKLWKNLLSNLLNFNTLYLGLLAFTAATAFTSPLTFLVLAFAPERAARATEALLGKILPKAQPAPSTAVKPLADPNEAKPDRWPQFHYWLKTGILIGSMAVLGFGLGGWVFGLASLGKNLLIAGALASLSFLFSPQIIKVTMKDTPANEKEDPEFFAIMKDLHEIINAKRAQKGQKPIPMPEMVNDPLTAPNAYATGRSPFKALVGVTKGIKEMLLDVEGLRASLVRLLAASDPNGKPFKVFRKAIAGSIPGLSAQATPREVAAAVLRAKPEDLKKLGVRALRGVLSHEFSHVMDRHMLLNAIASSISSAVAFSSYGVMWAVGQVKIAAKKLKDRIFPVKQSPQGGRVGIEPIALGLAAKSLPALLQMFGALWAPIVMQLTQMASSRADEGMADEDGAKLSQDPESLALALGLLMTWRPKAKGAAIAPERLPLVAANAGLFTVNPLEQMQKAGALPKLDPMVEMVVGKQDDFLFNLFVTHPDTTLRIERLYEMSEAKDAGAKP